MNIYIYVYVFIYRYIFLVSTIMYNRTECEDIVQIDNFVSVIFIYYLNFAAFYIFSLF